MQFTTIKNLLTLITESNNSSRQDQIDEFKHIASIIEKTGKIEYFLDVFSIMNEYVFIPNKDENGNYDFEALSSKSDTLIDKESVSKRVFIGGWSGQGGYEKEVTSIIVPHLARMIKTKKDLFDILNSNVLGLSQKQKAYLIENSKEVFNQIVDEIILNADSVFKFSDRKALDDSYIISEVKDLFKRLSFLKAFMKSEEVKDRIIADFRKEISKIESEESFHVDIYSAEVGFSNHKDFFKQDWIFVRQLEFALEIAVTLDSILQEDIFINEVYDLPEVKHFEKQLEKIVNDLSKIDENQVYTTSTWLMNSAFGINDFFRDLFKMFKLITPEKGNALNTKVIRWFYNLLKGGDVHNLKKKFMDAHTKLLPDILSKADFKSYEQEIEEYISTLK